MNVRFFLLLFTLATSAFADQPGIEQHVTRTIIIPWAAKHLPEFRFVGPNEFKDPPYSWRLVRTDDPEMKRTFPLDIELDFSLTEATACAYMHCNDWSFVGVENTGSVPTRIGDESDAFDIRETGRGDTGGWVYVRVGTAFIFLRSYSVPFETLTAFAKVLAASAPQFPEPPREIRTTRETAMRRDILAARQRQSDFERLKRK